MHPERIWYLLARKITDEASEQELNELANMLNENEELNCRMQMLTAFWKCDLQVEMVDGEERKVAELMAKIK